jgi:hypothetical protein
MQNKLTTVASAESRIGTPKSQRQTVVATL